MVASPLLCVAKDKLRAWFPLRGLGGRRDGEEGGWAWWIKGLETQSEAQNHLCFMCLGKGTGPDQGCKAEGGVQCFSAKGWSQMRNWGTAFARVQAQRKCFFSPELQSTNSTPWGRSLQDFSERRGISPLKIWTLCEHYEHYHNRAIRVLYSRSWTQSLSKLLGSVLNLWTAVFQSGSPTEEFLIFFKKDLTFISHMNMWVPLCRGFLTWLTHTPTPWACSGMKVFETAFRCSKPAQNRQLCLLISSYFTLIILPSCPLWALWSFTYTQISPRWLYINLLTDTPLPILVWTCFSLVRSQSSH